MVKVEFVPALYAPQQIREILYELLQAIPPGFRLEQPVSISDGTIEWVIFNWPEIHRNED
jgi:hypothetical protein